MARRARNLADGRWPGCGADLILPLDLNPAWKACLRFHPLLHFCATVSRAHIEFFWVNSPKR